MWDPIDLKSGSPSENSHVHDLWSFDLLRSGDQINALFNEYLNSTEASNEPKGPIEGIQGKHDGSFKSRVLSTSLQPQILAPSTAGLGFELTLAEDVQPDDNNAERTIPPWTTSLMSATAQTEPRFATSIISTNVLVNETASLTQFDLEDASLFKQATSPVIRLESSPPINKQPDPQPLRYKSTINQTTLNHNIKNLKPAKRSFSSIRKYRQLDERQSRRPPLRKKHTSYNTLLADNIDKLDPMIPSSSSSSPSSSQGYDFRPEYMDYHTQHINSYILNKDSISMGPRTAQIPLSPPLSSARSSFLTARNGSINYNLSTESLPVYNGQPTNSLSRPHSMPQLQDQSNDNLFDTQPRCFHHGASSEYLSHQSNFEEDLASTHTGQSTYSNFNAPYAIPDQLELDATGSASSSVQSSSPQQWWDQSANLEFQQEGILNHYLAPSHAAYNTLPLSPTKNSFEPMSNELHPMLYLQTQSRSPISEQERIYAHMLDQNRSAESSIPSPPGSPGYFFSPAMSQDGYFAHADSSAVQFVDPFHQSQCNGTYLKTPTPYDHVAPHSPIRQMSSLNPAAALSSHTSLTSHKSHGSLRHAVSPRPSFARKITNPSRVSSISFSSRMGSLSGVSSKSNSDSKEVSFVNFTPYDAGKILSGVAPSGSSKTKARREREALERRRKLSEAAAAAVLAAGGDPSAFPLDFS